MPSGRSTRTWAGGVAALLGVFGCGPSHDALLAALTSQDPRARAEAITGLARRGDPDDLDPLMTRVADKDDLVRSSLASALGRYDTRKAADALGVLTTDGAVAVQLLAARSLARMKDPRAREYLLLAYRRGDSPLRAAVAEGLEAAGESASLAVAAEAKALWKRYTSALARGGTAEKVAAAEEIGRSGRPEALALLVPLLAGPSAPVAAAAARGLGASRLPGALGPLTGALAATAPEVAGAAIEGLRALGNPAAAPALAGVAQRGDERTDAAALAAIAALSHDGAALCAVAAAGDESTAGQAAELVARRGWRCDPAPLVARLLRRGCSAPAPGREGVLGGGDSAAALAALAALGGKATEEEGRCLLSLLRSGDRFERPLAARAAGALALAVAVPDLEQALAGASRRLQDEREHWVKEPLPLAYAPGFEPAGAIGGKYRERYDKLMAKLAAQGVQVQDDDLAPLGPLFGSDASADEALSAEATLALVRLHVPKAAQLAGVLARDPVAAVRAYGGSAALALPPSAGWPFLRELAGDRDGDVREAAFRDLAVLAREPGADAAALSAFLAGAIARIQDSDLIEVVAGLPAAAIPAAAVPALADDLKQPGLTSDAARALGAIGTPAARAVLSARLRAAPSPGLPEVVAAVAALQMTEDAPLLRPLLFHVRPAVRAAAARALRKLPGAAKEIEALRDDYDGEVRRAAGL